MNSSVTLVATLLLSALPTVGFADAPEEPPAPSAALLPRSDLSSPWSNQGAQSVVLGAVGGAAVGALGGFVMLAGSAVLLAPLEFMGSMLNGTCCQGESDARTLWELAPAGAIIGGGIGMVVGVAAAMQNLDRQRHPSPSPEKVQVRATAGLTPEKGPMLGLAGTF
jgi:hypothetical protein